MKTILKRLAVRLFLGDKFRGRVATVIAATFTSVLFSYIPGLHGLVEVAVRALFEISDEVIITQKVLAGVLVLPISYIIDACIQEFLIRENNRTLQVIKPLTDYDGPIAGLVGNVAREAIEEKLLQFDTPIQDER